MPLRNLKRFVLVTESNRTGNYAYWKHSNSKPVVNFFKSRLVLPGSLFKQLNTCFDRICNALSTIELVL